MLSLWLWLFVAIDWRTAGGWKRVRALQETRRIDRLRRIPGVVTKLARHFYFARAICRVASPSACQASFFINNRQPEADSAPGNAPSFLLQEFHACGIPILAPREPSRCVPNPIDEIYQLPSLVFYTAIVSPCRFLRFLSAAASIYRVLFVFLPSAYLVSYPSTVDQL